MPLHLHILPSATRVVQFFKFSSALSLCHFLGILPTTIRLGPEDMSTRLGWKRCTAHSLLGLSFHLTLKGEEPPASPKCLRHPRVVHMTFWEDSQLFDTS